MVNRILIIALITFAIIPGCKKNTTTDCIKAEIIRVTCASTVLQALNNNTVGEDNWTDIYSSKKFDNVFKIANPCNLASEHKVGDEVYVTIKKATDSNCIVCALYDAAPATSYDITSIGSLPCN